MTETRTVNLTGISDNATDAACIRRAMERVHVNEIVSASVSLISEGTCTVTLEF